MENTGAEVMKKHPAGESAEFDINPWVFAKGKEQKQTLETVSDEKSKKAKKEVSPLSTQLEGMVIKAEDGGNPNKAKSDKTEETR